MYSSSKVKMKILITCLKLRKITGKEYLVISIYLTTSKMAQSVSRP